MKKILALVILVLSFVGCSSLQKNNNQVNLKGKEFVLTSVYPEAGITLGFEGNRFYGFSGVNRYFGQYKLEGSNKIVIENPAGTRMAGPTDLMKKEDAYMNSIVDADKVELKNEMLIIYTKKGEKLQFKQTK